MSLLIVNSFLIYLKESVIGYEGSKFKNCLFEKVNFLGAGFIRVEFLNCKFEDCNLTLVDFNTSTFENCEFEGLLRETWFKGRYKYGNIVIEEFGKPKKNKMKNVSFLKADLSDVMFTNDCDLSPVVLPEKGKYFKISNLKIFLKELKNKSNDLSENNKKELNIFIEVLLVYANKQDMYILHYQDLIESHGKDVADYIWSFLCKRYG